MTITPPHRRPGAEPDALRPFVASGIRPWGGVRVALSPRVVVALWILFGINFALAGWLLAVRSGVAPCNGPLCGVATLGDHPVLTLTLSELSAAALVVAMPMTRGLTLAGGPQLALIAAGAALGATAAAGVVAILMGAVVCLLVVVGLLVFVADNL
jgi:hypothetical protein